MSTELQEKSLELLLNIQRLDVLTQSLMSYAHEIQLIADRLKEQANDDN